MSDDIRSAFAPYRIPPGVLPEEAARLAAEVGAEPLVARADEALSAGLLAGALAEVPAGLAGSPEEACRGADGSPSGTPGALRACPNSERHRARVEAAEKRALEGGFAGVVLEAPDAALAPGVLGAGFCADCQRAFAREMAREYGDHFQPLDLLALTREAVAASSGALSHEHLPFGREFWRARASWLEQSVAAAARAARDMARAAGRPFEIVARFEALGPAQFRAARQLDAAVFPAAAQNQSTGAGLFRLLRAVMGRRPAAVALAGEGPLDRLAAVAAACGVEVVLPFAARVPPPIAAVRRFARAAAARGRAAALCQPVAECAILYSAESDLWSGGDHRAAVERAGDALAALRVQAPVVLRPTEAPPGAVLVLAGASALSPLEAQEVRRRLETGTAVLCLGEPGTVDEGGRPSPLPFPPGKPGGVRVEKGLVVGLPLPPPTRPGSIPDPRAHEDLARALPVLLGRGRRALSTSGRSPLFAASYLRGSRLDVHLAALAGPAQGATLFLGLHVVGDAHRGRFKSMNGRDERVPLNPSGFSVSTVLPSFEGYGVLSVPG